MGDILNKIHICLAVCLSIQKLPKKSPHVIAEEITKLRQQQKNRGLREGFLTTWHSATRDEEGAAMHLPDLCGVGSGETGGTTGDVGKAGENSFVNGPMPSRRSKELDLGVDIW